MIITLLGEPKSTNHIYKSHCRFGYPSVYLSKEGKDLKESYMWQAKSSWKNEPPLEGDVHVVIKLFFKSKIHHDIDNYGKILLDSLTGIVWKDDGQIVKMTVIKGKDKDCPRAEIEIT